MLLNEYDKSVLTDIVVYIRMSGISPYDQEKVRRDVREMIAEGERRGKTAREIIGEDYRQFCDDVIAEIPRLSGVAYFLSLLRDVLLAAGVLLVIWAVFQFIEQGAVERFSVSYGYSRKCDRRSDLHRGSFSAAAHDLQKYVRNRQRSGTG